MVIPGVICHPFFLGFDVAIDDTSVCAFADVTLEVIPEESTPPGTVYEWDFGADAVPPTATGIGPHVVYYETGGTKTVTVTASYQSIVTEGEGEIEVSTGGACLGQIVGTLEDDLGSPLINYNILLYDDVDEDGIADGASVRNVFTNGTGGWSLASLPPGHYLLVANLLNYTLISAIDSNDIGTDGVVDTFTILPNNNAANREAFKIFVAPGAIQGRINLIATTP